MVTIRSVEESDWTGILLLERQEYGSDSFSVHSVRMFPVLNSRSCWIAQGHGVRGYCLASRVDSDPEIAWILALVVGADSRREGIGSQLVGACVRGLTIDGVTQIWLSVEESNLAAQALYSRQGFRVDRFCPGFYGEKGDRLLMKLQIA